jgi:hypothetical protein
VHFFIDTEFTNLPWVARSELLWIAVVDETGTREFSAVNADCDLDACSTFVRQHVVPQLHRAHRWLPHVELASALTRFVSEASRSELRFWAWQPSVADVAFLADDPSRAPELHARFADWDYRLTLDLLGEVPLSWPVTCDDVHARATQARIQLPANHNPHDPLADARWARDVWLSAVTQPSKES